MPSKMFSCSFPTPVPVQAQWYEQTPCLPHVINPCSWNFKSSKAMSWTRDAVVSTVGPEDGLEDSERPDGDRNVLRLDHDTVAKIIEYDTSPDAPEEHREVLAMKLVHEKTTIPIPNVYNVFIDPIGSLTGCIVMDYIHGTRLDRAWPGLSLWSKFRVAWALRSYIRQLRRISSSRPGPLGATPQFCPGMTISSMWDEGPFTTAEELTRFINWRSHRMRGVPIPPHYETPEPLVFTHNDINMRNIILGDDGQVWLIDWDWSGFYPPFFEFSAMVIAAEDRSTRTIPPSWRFFLPFIAGPHFGRLRWLVGLTP